MEVAQAGPAMEIDEERKKLFEEKLGRLISDDNKDTVAYRDAAGSWWGNASEEEKKKWFLAGVIKFCQQSQYIDNRKKTGKKTAVKSSKTITKQIARLESQVQKNLAKKEKLIQENNLKVKDVKVYVSEDTPSV